MREYFIAPVAAHDPIYRADGINYFTHNEEMINQGYILSGHAVLGTYPEEIILFTDSFITDRTLIWYKMVEIFQVLDAWAYLKPAKNHRDGRLGFRLIYNHYLVPSNTDHMAYSAEKKIVQCSYIREKRN